MTDTDLLHHCMQALTEGYGKIANDLLIEHLRIRLDAPAPPPDNNPWHDTASY